MLLALFILQLHYFVLIRKFSAVVARVLKISVYVLVQNRRWRILQCCGHARYYIAACC